MRIRLLAALALLAVQPVLAEDPKPSEDSVRHLFEVMNTRHLLDDMSGQMDKTIRESARMGLGAQTLNPQQQKIFDDMMTKLMSIMKEQMDWKTLEPVMIGAYRDSFTQQEVDALAGFYASPVGHSVAAKLPRVTQASMQMMQERMRGIIPRIAQLEKDAAVQMKAAADTGAQPSAPPASAPQPAPQASPH